MGPVGVNLSRTVSSCGQWCSSAAYWCRQRFRQPRNGSGSIVFAKSGVETSAIGESNLPCLEKCRHFSKFSTLHSQKGQGGWKTLKCQIFREIILTLTGRVVPVPCPAAFCCCCCYPFQVQSQNRFSWRGFCKELSASGTNNRPRSF